MRSPSPALYDDAYEFEYAKAYYLKKEKNHQAVIISSGHAVLESLSAAELLAAEGIPVSVADMPSYDSGFLKDAAGSGVLFVFVEQNNGLLFDLFSRDVLKNQISLRPKQVTALNTRDAQDKLRFIQSGSYEQLIEALGLRAVDIVSVIKKLR
jgi:transketolase C-terminal domain/subunit